MNSIENIGCLGFRDITRSPPSFSMNKCASDALIGKIRIIIGEKM